MRATIHRSNAVSTILFSLVVVLGAAAAQAQHVGTETDYPANLMSSANPMSSVIRSTDPSADVELFLVQSNEGPIEERKVIVDSSVDPDLVRIDAGAEPPFDIGRGACSAKERRTIPAVAPRMR